MLLTVAKFPRIPSSFANDASRILSEYYVGTAVPVERIPDLTRAFAECCLAPAAVAELTMGHELSVKAVVSRFTNWLLGESVRDQGERVGIVLDAFEEQLRRHAAAGGLQLLPAYAAAWGVLRKRAGRSGPAKVPGLQFPLAKRALAALRQMNVNLAEFENYTPVDFENAVNDLCVSVERMPASPEALRARLGLTHTVADIENLWTQYLALPAEDPLKAQSDFALAEFVYAVRKPRVNTLQQREAWAKLGETITSQLPSPLPLPVLHSFLATEDRLASDTTFNPYTDDDDRSTRRDTVLADAAKTWKAFLQHGGVPDAKAFLLYIGLLGKYHQDIRMFKVWDEMVGNKASKAAHEKEVRKDKGDKALVPWPPTIVLNQVLSAGYLIGGRAAEMATHLYKASLDPLSPISPDLFTINTTLRFAAHLGNIPKMNETIADAGRAQLTPDIVTYTTLVQGLLKADRMDLARKTLDAMRARGMEPNERMAAMFVADLAHSGSASGLRRAEDIIRDMRNRGIKTSVPMWTSLIAGYFAGGWVEDGELAVGRMHQNGVKLNDVGYNIVLTHVLSGVNDRNANPDKVAQVCQAAYALFCNMREQHVVPNHDTYTILLGGLLRPVRTGTSKETSQLELANVLADIEQRGFKTTKAGLSRLVEQARRAVAGEDLSRKGFR